ncbi:MAG: DUF433 domain-containing protein [Chloracidobacterium sp.]|nr:DUF433 domain-containing protein [Chloracidobacterium sp.]MDW8216655.1 DUF433 domain-containing protein [Acidobacteriota bacterium]
MTPPPAIEAIPLVTDADGVIRIGHTRATLDTVVSAFLDEATAETITAQSPSLPLADVYAVIAYYLRRRPDVDAYLKRRGEQAEAARQANEARRAPTGVRVRLLARRSGVTP